MRFLRERRTARRKARVLAAARAEEARQRAKSLRLPYPTEPGDWKGAGS